MSESDGRRGSRNASPKVAVKEKAPEKLPEKLAEKPRDGFMDGLFPKAGQGQLIPRPFKGRPSQREVIRTQETIPPTSKSEAQRAELKADLTSPSKIKQQAVRAAASAPRPKRELKPAQLAMALALIALIFVGMSRMMNHSQSVTDGGETSTESIQALQKRVDFHRSETGRRLNRDRINVQYDNAMTAPALPESARKVATPDMMQGLPLAEEQLRPTSRDRLQAENPDYSDSRIMYSLQEQQAAAESEEAAREAYISEFIANAAREGYKVKVDKTGRVTVVGRMPAAANATGELKLPNGEVIKTGGPATPGSIR